MLATPIVFLTLIFGYLSDDHGLGYCKTRCKETNTVCKRADEKCSTSKACGMPEYYKRLTPEERDIVLHAHNRFRNAIAIGEESEYGHNGSSDMSVLSYSSQLEFLAQCWANSCKLEHDECRATHRHKTIGQNIFIGFIMENALERAVQQWFAPVKDSDVSLMHIFKGSRASQIAPFTQLVWAKTTHVGCGRVGFLNRIFIVCNYYPAGNRIGQPVYKIGKPCQGCGFRNCNKDYPALCGEISPVEEWRGPFDLKGTRLSSNEKLLFSLVIISAINIHFL